MNIQEALKETGKATYDGASAHLQWRNCDLWWVDNDTGKWLEKASHKDLFEFWFIPYHDKKEIRPEKAGELWEHHKFGIACILLKNSKLIGTWVHEHGNTNPVSCISTSSDIIHNQNGWTRLYPPVEDENMERIEFENVSWDIINNKDIPVQERPAPYLENYEIGCPAEWGKISEIVENKPPMKMILEIREDKP